MNTFVEKMLIKIRKHSPYLSCDIYYDNLAVLRNEQFVVKLHSPITKEQYHFRSNRIRKSLKMAWKYLKKTQSIKILRTEF